MVLINGTKSVFNIQIYSYLRNKQVVFELVTIKNSVTTCILP